MPVLQIEAQVSTDELLQAATQLGNFELDQFTNRIIVLNAQRRAPSLNADESLLFAKINQGIPHEVQQRYNYLIDCRDEGKLTQDEYNELLKLTKLTEEYDVQRLEALTQLSLLRKVSLPQLMKQLNLLAPNYA